MDFMSILYLCYVENLCLYLQCTLSCIFLVVQQHTGTVIRASYVIGLHKIKLEIVFHPQIFKILISIGDIIFLVSIIQSLSTPRKLVSLYKGK